MASASSTQLPPGVSPNHLFGPLKELIDELRTFTHDTAENGQSDDLGVRTITAGSNSDALVPLFFRCTWPVGARSRHKLIWMKPSVPNEALGAAVNDAFRVIEAGGVVEKTVAIWGINNPFTDSSARGIAPRERVRRAVGLDDPPTQQQIIKMMEGTMNGIMQVVVGPERDARKCVVCRQPRPFTLGHLDDLRQSAFGPMMFCQDCVQRLGWQEINRIIGQAEAEGEQRARSSLNNSSG